MEALAGSREGNQMCRVELWADDVDQQVCGEVVKVVDGHCGCPSLLSVGDQNTPTPDTLLCLAMVGLP